MKSVSEIHDRIWEPGTCGRKVSHYLKKAIEVVFDFEQEQIAAISSTEEFHIRSARMTSARAKCEGELRHIVYVATTTRSLDNGEGAMEAIDWVLE